MVSSEYHLLRLLYLDVDVAFTIYHPVQCSVVYSLKYAFNIYIGNMRKTQDKTQQYNARHEYRHIKWKSIEHTT